MQTMTGAIETRWPLSPLDAVPRPHWSTPAFTAVGIALWVLLASLTNSGQFADNIEQFVWAQSLEPGYWKHPPLPSWLLWGALKLFGFWSGWTYLLSAACFCGTAFFGWRIARRIAGARVAGIAVLLQGLHLRVAQVEMGLDGIVGRHVVARRARGRRLREQSGGEGCRQHGDSSGQCGVSFCYRAGAVPGFSQLDQHPGLRIVKSLQNLSLHFPLFITAEGIRALDCFNRAGPFNVRPNSAHKYGNMGQRK